MKYEVVQSDDQWVVSRDGQELARFAGQDEALNEVAVRLRGADADAPTALCMRYERRG
ncbi:hypothetical protein ACO2Q0_16475 [Phenylobacterium sp. VNQ135]|uniref:hypothetical protein n=1 Tax=Phenylobacterium sp. VNQ135 TaxID=3400922 RepID=UPI003C1271C0